MTVTVGSDAKVTMAKEASVSDLKVGDTVMVIGEVVGRHDHCHPHP